MPYGYPPRCGPKSGCRDVEPASMLRNHAALCESTGSLEMSVFQILLLGNIRQPARSPAVLASGAASAAVHAGALTAMAPQAATTAQSPNSKRPQRARIRT